VKSNEWRNRTFAALDIENPVSIKQSRIQNKNLSAAEKIAEKFKEKQMSQLPPVLKALVLGWNGQLQEGEIERTKEYARGLAAELKKGQQAPDREVREED